MPSALLVIAGCHAEPDTSRRAAAASESSPRLANQPAAMPTTLRSINGLYFGASDTPDGQRAWLLRLGPAAAGSGRLYAPPDNPELVGTDVRGHPDSLVLRSPPGLGGMYYIFTGHVEGGALRGVIETVRTRRPADSVVARSAVTLTPVPRASAEPAGLYSNLALNDESGDLVGEEVILLPTAGGRWNAIVAGLDGDFTPYAASDVSVAGDTLHLRLRTASGAESYRATLAPGGGLTFIRTDPTAAGGHDPSTLTRQHDLPGLLVESMRNGPE